MNTSIPSTAIFTKEGVDALFAEWDVPQSPGCALGVIQDGELIYARGYEYADLDHDIPITSGSIFDLASTSKQFTAMCIALLAEAGTLSLDDDIRKFLPELPDLEARGLIREGYFADLVVFDPQRIADQATFTGPHRYPTGIHHVLVNGKLALQDGKQAGARAGQVLRKRG